MIKRSRTFAPDWWGRPRTAKG